MPSPLRRVVGWVARKELVEILRDRRSLVVLVLLPIALYPLLSIATLIATTAQLRKLAARTYVVWVEDLQALPEPLRTELLAADDAGPPDAGAAEGRGVQWRLRLQAPPTDADYDLALAEGRAAAVLRGVGEVEAALARGEQPRLEVVYDGGIDTSTFAKDRVVRAVEAWSAELARARLDRAGLPASTLEPVVAAPKNAGSPGALIGRILAALLVILALTGAYYPALDLGAGEKERGTLETLLLAPVPRIAIALGKYVAVLVVATVCALLHLLSLGLTFSSFAFVAPQAAGLELSVDPLVLLAMLAILLPLVALFSALSLAVSTFAASHKEGQAYLTPLVLVGMVPAMVAAIPGITLTPTLCCVPVVGAALLVKELLADTASLGHGVLVFASSLAYAALALRWVASLYDREEVLWRPAAARAPDLLGLRAARRPPEPGAAPRRPSLPQAVALGLLVVLLVWLLGVPLQTWSLTWGLLLTLVGLVAAPSVVYARVLRVDLRDTFGLRWPGALPLAAAVLIGVGAIAANLDLRQLQEGWSGPLTAEELTDLQEKTRVFTEDLPPAVMLLLLAALPAVCEELCFRGFVLRGLTRESGPWAAAVVSSLLFSVAHMDPSRLVTTFATGLLLALVVLRTGSLLPAFLLHLLHNGVAAAAERWSWVGEAGLPPAVRGGGWATLAAGLGLLLLATRGSTAITTEEQEGP